MLNKNAAERITLEVVQSHPYLSEDTRKIGRKSSNRKISLLPSSKDIEKHIKTVNAIFDLLTYLLKLVDLILLVSKKLFRKKKDTNKGPKYVLFTPEQFHYFLLVAVAYRIIDSSVLCQ